MFGRMRFQVGGAGRFALPFLSLLLAPPRLDCPTSTRFSLLPVTV